ncbi:threonine-tRNA ligase 2 [Wolffia australiana]
MADGDASQLEEILKTFSQRAAEAEERLARLEAAVSADRVSGDKEHSLVQSVRSKLEISQQELVAEREKASKEIEKLIAENAKLQYRISHLVRALKDADSKVGS